MKKQGLHPRTEMINNKQKNQAKIARNDALLWLSTVFPQAFDNSILIRPLKLGVMADILAHADEAAAKGISKSKLREAVVVFTRRIDYLTCLKAREMRIDLEGNTVAAVTEEEANNAALKIKKRVEKCAKNARKNLGSKTPGQSSVKPSEAPRYSADLRATLNYPEHLPAFSVQHYATPAASAPSVIVKHKSARTFDPDAVARMKEKLGLSRAPKAEETL